MKILVVHGWLTGNLGDVMQTSVLLRHLRGLAPESLVLSGYAPGALPPAVDELARSVDEVRREEDRPAPARRLPIIGRSLGRRLVGRAWQRGRRELFAGFDAIVAAPGPYVWRRDPRRYSAYLDIELARRMGKPFVLSSHSIGPLRNREYRRLRPGAVIVSREPATGRLLEAAGLAHVSSADYAFLYEPPQPEAASRITATLERPYTAVFLRARNVDTTSLRIANGALESDEGRLATVEGTVVLATSDPLRDDTPLTTLAGRLHVPFVSCGTASELVGLVRGAAKVVSDRYHPLVAAGAAGVPIEILPLGFAPTKMAGLRELLESLPLERIRGLARAGLAAVSGALQRDSGRE